MGDLVVPQYKHGQAGLHSSTAQLVHMTANQAALMQDQRYGSEQQERCRAEGCQAHAAITCAAGVRSRASGSSSANTIQIMHPAAKPSAIGRMVCTHMQTQRRQGNKGAVVWSSSLNLDPNLEAT